MRGARRLTHHDADAEDLLQETLIRAYAGFGNFQPGTNVQAWLFRIQHNQWINAYRWKERRPAEVLSGGITDRDLAGYGTQVPAGLRSVEAELFTVEGGDHGGGGDHPEQWQAAIARSVEFLRKHLGLPADPGS